MVADLNVHWGRRQPIEIWFSILLVRKLLRHGNFTSKEHLQQRIESFIAYFNASALTGMDPLLLAKTDPPGAQTFLTRRSSLPHGQPGRHEPLRRKASIPLFD